MTRLQAPFSMALVFAMRSTHWWRHPEVGTSWSPHTWPDSLSRTRIFRAGLPSEPGRRFCQYLPIKLQLAILSPQLPQLLSLVRRKPIFPKTVISVGLTNPRPYGHRRRTKLLRKIRWLPTSPYQFYHLLPKLRRIRWSCLTHGSSPFSLRPGGLWSCGKRGPFPLSHSLHRLDDDESHQLSTLPG